MMRSLVLQSGLFFFLQEDSRWANLQALLCLCLYFIAMKFPPIATVHVLKDDDGEIDIKQSVWYP